MSLPAFITTPATLLVALVLATGCANSQHGNPPEVPTPSNQAPPNSPANQPPPTTSGGISSGEAPGPNPAPPIPFEICKTVALVPAEQSCTITLAKGGTAATPIFSASISPASGSGTGVGVTATSMLSTPGASEVEYDGTGFHLQITMPAVAGSPVATGHVTVTQPGFSADADVSCAPTK